MDAWTAWAQSAVANASTELAKAAEVAKEGLAAAAETASEEARKAAERATELGAAAANGLEGLRDLDLTEIQRATAAGISNLSLEGIVAAVNDAVDGPPVDYEGLIRAGISASLVEFVGALTPTMVLESVADDPGANDFELDAFQERHATLVSSFVGTLTRLRLSLVPSRLTDEAFWKAYFKLAEPYVEKARAAYAADALPAPATGTMREESAPQPNPPAETSVAGQSDRTQDDHPDSASAGNEEGEGAGAGQEDSAAPPSRGRRGKRGKRGKAAVQSDELPAAAAAAAAVAATAAQDQPDASPAGAPERPEVAVAGVVEGTAEVERLGDAAATGAVNGNSEAGEKAAVEATMAVGDADAKDAVPEDTGDELENLLNELPDDDPTAELDEGDLDTNDDDLDALLEELGDAGGEANDGSGEGEGDDDDLEAFLAEQLDES